MQIERNKPALRMQCCRVISTSFTGETMQDEAQIVIKGIDMTEEGISLVVDKEKKTASLQNY